MTEGGRIVGLGIGIDPLIFLVNPFYQAFFYSHMFFLPLFTAALIRFFFDDVVVNMIRVGKLLKIASLLFDIIGNDPNS